jgi:hypothetical protein
VIEDFTGGMQRETDKCQAAYAFDRIFCLRLRGHAPAE